MIRVVLEADLSQHFDGWQLTSSVSEHVFFSTSQMLEKEKSHLGNDEATADLVGKNTAICVQDLLGCKQQRELCGRRWSLLIGSPLSQRWHFRHFTRVWLRS